MPVDIRSADMLYFSRIAINRTPIQTRQSMVQMEVSGVYNSNPQSSFPQVVLKEIGGEAYLPIVIGRFEAAAISMAQSDQKPARPISYDLARQILVGMDSHVARVEITSLHESTYYAEVHLVDGNGQTHAVDARPSDAIALALRFEAPIFAAAAILEEAGVSRPNQEEDQGELTPEFTPLLEVEPGESRALDSKPVDEVELLKRRMAQAIAEEVYEEAARLRDEINRLEDS
jgi:hypothetical protein